MKIGKEKDGTRFHEIHFIRIINTLVYQNNKTPGFILSQKWPHLFGIQDLSKDLYQIHGVQK